MILFFRGPPTKGAYAAPLLRGLLCPRGACADLSALLPISPGRSELASEALDGCRALAVPGSDGSAGPLVLPQGRTGGAGRADRRSPEGQARLRAQSRPGTSGRAGSQGVAGGLACRPPQARRARSRRRRPGPGAAGPGVCIQPCSCMQLKRLSAGRRAADSLETGGVSSLPVQARRARSRRRSSSARGWGRRFRLARARVLS